MECTCQGPIRHTISLMYLMLSPSLEEESIEMFSKCKYNLHNSLSTKHNDRILHFFQTLNSTKYQESGYNHFTVHVGRERWKLYTGYSLKPPTGIVETIWGIFSTFLDVHAHPTFLAGSKVYYVHNHLYVVVWGSSLFSSPPQCLLMKKMPVLSYSIHA